jgi:hypothetical protein
MNFIQEMRQIMAEEEDMPVLLLTPAWSATALTDPSQNPVWTIEKLPDGLHLYARAFVAGEMVQLNVPIRNGAGQLRGDGTMEIFGLRKLGFRTWLVQPSVNIPGQVHAFVVLCDAPEPAPWESQSEKQAMHAHIHQSTDMLLAYYLINVKGSFPSQLSVMELMQWSARKMTER